MKKILLSLSVVLAILMATVLTGCSAEPETKDTVAEPVKSETAEEAETTESEDETTEAPAEETEEEPSVEETEASEPKTVEPLTDTVMEGLDDSIVNVSLENGDVYLNDEGALMMKMEVYTYDKYDMVDIAELEIGDSIVFLGESVAIETLERTEDGSVVINGGFAEDGLDLVTYDDGVYSVISENDSKEWYLAGEAEYKVSVDFEFTDSSDLDSGEKVYYPGDFIEDDTIIDDYFNPYNTTVRIENGLVVEMNRVYIP